ncbi:hypothetical protein ABZ946_19515 [Streptomyces sp. NPDC046324]|uniref:hypothetical protein n=1 Tax=Streptomyces sp. NPDC046324 TaxID=3154915 RepID=UPI00340C178B
MAPFTTRTVSAIMLLSLAAVACSSGGDEGPVAGATASEVCGGFAKDAPSEAALKAVMGTDRFTSSLSEPEKAIATLREAALGGRNSETVQPRAQAVPFCWLLPAEGGKASLRVLLRPELEIPERDPRFGEGVTYFSSGGRAYASDSSASVFFRCRMDAPAQEIVVQARLEGPSGAKPSGEDARARVITLANAAARDVAADLGCEDAGLSSGVPAKSVG